MARDVSRYDPSVKVCPKCYRVAMNATRVCFYCDHEFYPAKSSTITYTITVKNRKHLDELCSLVHDEKAQYNGALVKSVKVLPSNNDFQQVEIVTYR